MLVKSQTSDIVKTVVHWSFHDYVEGGQNLIENWYENDLLDGGRFGFDNLLKDAAKIKSEFQWSGFKYLQGDPKKEKIWQIAFLMGDN